MLVAGCSDFGADPAPDPPANGDDSPGDDPGAAPDTAHFAPSRDNSLYEHPGGLLSNGVGDHLFAGVTIGTQIRRGLVRFELAGVIPTGATVESARLTLNCSRVRETTPRSFTLHRVLADWGEGNSDADGEEGQGASAAAGDATWLHRTFDTIPWSSPGGDFDPSPSASVPVSGVGLSTWGSSPALVADVQAWVDDPASNHGWLLAGDESVDGAAKRFDSREHPTAANRPRLTVVYRTAATTRR